MYFSIRLELLKSLILCVFILRVYADYKRYDVEDECSSGRMTVALSATDLASAAILRATRHTSYRFGMDCWIEVIPPATCGVVASVRQVDMRVELTGKCKDYIKIYQDSGSAPEIFSSCQTSLDRTESPSYVTSGPMRIAYHTGQDLDNETLTGNSGFELTVTAFHTAKAEPKLRNDTNYFVCTNDRIIWRGLICDGHNNCGDRSDETEEAPSKCPSSSKLPYIIGGTILGVGCFGGGILGMVFRKRVRKRLSTLRRTRRELKKFNIQHSQIS